MVGLFCLLVNVLNEAIQQPYRKAVMQKGWVFT